MVLRVGCMREQDRFFIMLRVKKLYVPSLAPKGMDIWSIINALKTYTYTHTTQQGTV